MLVENFNMEYLILYFAYLLILISPLAYFIIILKKTNGESHKIKDFEKEQLRFKNYISTIIGTLIPLSMGIYSFIAKKDLTINNITSLPYFRFTYGIYAFLIILFIYFILQNNHKEYSVFENFILINILKFNIISLETHEDKKVILFTRKEIKRDEVIKNIKHIFGGIYYY